MTALLVYLSSSLGHQRLSGACPSQRPSTSGPLGDWFTVYGSSSVPMSWSIWTSPFYWTTVLPYRGRHSKLMSNALWRRSLRRMCGYVWCHPRNQISCVELWLNVINLIFFVTVQSAAPQPTITTWVFTSGPRLSVTCVWKHQTMLSDCLLARAQ